ncbi:hypothetical protein KO507_16400 [Gilvimarinus agarilyticus]|uniref:hypothetical protein n=1 Tax=unclassified Gilvimarinus TaxID=2642066 RepID=UPI001C08A5E4|nr:MULTISPECIES: hypothetical protein [unclassified Gilvimarinus]MBU2887348.1 hypothetical protein [Gilvimarinus agarilyticus]MDO6572007.1 hypothetical protein [Gilvimarinus sp. 2_MG-2023]MDO6746075.1 hypothetical protein [Gilvimarinus sp. 1_MG-2023]
MKKTDKKLDNQLCRELTKVCELAKDCYAGFEWLTHWVNYQDFPASLVVLCVYDTDAQLASADRTGVRRLVATGLHSMGVELADLSRQVRFDSEESCAREDNGRWQKRLG